MTLAGLTRAQIRQRHPRLWTAFGLENLPRRRRVRPDACCGLCGATGSGLTMRLNALPLCAACLRLVVDGVLAEDAPPPQH